MRVRNLECTATFMSCLFNLFLMDTVLCQCLLRAFTFGKNVMELRRVKKGYCKELLSLAKGPLSESDQVPPASNQDTWLLDPTEFDT